jgi:hypothetical protein
MIWAEVNLHERMDVLFFSLDTPIWTCAQIYLHNDMTKSSHIFFLGKEIKLIHVANSPRHYDTTMSRGTKILEPVPVTRINTTFSLLEKKPYTCGVWQTQNPYWRYIIDEGFLYISVLFPFNTRTRSVLSWTSSLVLLSSKRFRNMSRAS